MLITVRSFLGLQQCLEHMTCPLCKRRINSLSLGRKSCQYRLSGVCESCYSQLLWINSEDHTKPGSTRKFVESMTVSGVNYWQYKRSVPVFNLGLCTAYTHMHTLFLH